MQYERLAHHRHGVEFVLDFFGIDVLSVRSEEHVLDASFDEKMPVGRKASEVTGVVPSVAVDCLSSGLLVLVVSEHDVHAACDDLTFVAVATVFTSPDDASVARLQGELHMWNDGAARAEHVVLPVAVGDHRSGFRGAVSAGDGELHTHEEFFDFLIHRCASGHDLIDASAELVAYPLHDALLYACLDEGKLQKVTCAVGVEVRIDVLAYNLFYHHRDGEQYGRLYLCSR